MYQKKRHLVAIGAVIIMLIAIAASGCGNSSSSNTPADVPALQKVTIAQPVMNESWMPVYLAAQLGYFKEEGLDVSFTTFQGGQGPLVIASLLAGDSQFALTGYDQVLKTNEKGKQTKMIVATTDRFPWTFIVAKDVKSGEDLKGKKISAGMAGSSPRAFIRTVIRYLGLDPDKDVQYVSLPGSGNLGALEKGEVAGAEVDGRQLIELLKRGYKPLVDLKDPEVHRKVLGTDKYHLFVVQVTDEYISQHPDTVQKFVNAVVRAGDWENTHSPDEIAKVLAPLFPHRSPALEKQVIEVALKAQSKDGYFSSSAHDAAVRLSLDAKMITKQVAMDSVVDQTFLKKAHEKLGR